MQPLSRSESNPCCLLVILASSTMVFSSFNSAAFATTKRAIFGQNPQEIASYFGTPVQVENCIPEAKDQEPAPPQPGYQWCYFLSQESRKNYQQYREGEIPLQRYLYQPADFIPEFPSQIEFLFTNNKVSKIFIKVDTAGSASNFIYTATDAKEVFNYIFGEPAPIWYEYRNEYELGTAIAHEVCLGKGVASVYTSYGEKGPVPSLAMFPNPDCAATEYTFADIQDHWAQVFIENLAMRNIVNGFPDGTFRPNALITRAEFASLISAVFTASATRIPIDFVDVSPDFWGYSAIQTAYRYGYLSGYPGRIFRPNQPITKTEVLVSLTGYLRSASDQVNLGVLSLYQDQQAIPNYARTAVARTTEANWVVNYPNPRQLEPNRPATRGEVAAIVYQALLANEEFVVSPYIVSP